MTRYCADDFSNWQLKVHRLLGQGFGVEDIAIELGETAEAIRGEVSMLRQKGKLKITIETWAKPAITYGE